MPSEGKRRVLVVDDNQDAAILLAEALDELGFEAQVAFEGTSALELAADFAPEVALLDIGLPGMDGLELARRLRALPGDGQVRLVALTGYGEENDRRRTLAAGFDDHLVKPINLDVLEKLLARLLRAQA